MSRLFVSHGKGHLVFNMTGPQPPEFRNRAARDRSNDQRWRALPVEGTAHWRRLTGADRRAKRAKLLLILAAVLVGIVASIVKGS